MITVLLKLEKFVWSYLDRFPELSSDNLMCFVQNVVQKVTYNITRSQSQPANRNTTVDAD